MGLFDFFEQNEVEVQVAIVALALTLGRLLTPSDPTDDEEIAFVQALMDFIGAYFTNGGSN